MHQKNVYHLFVALLAAVMALTACGQPYTFHGLLLDAPTPAADFSLTGPQGQTVHLSDFRGKLAVLFFGYTSCPDVCPTTLVDLARAMKQMGNKAADVQVIMVTVDPERDTPQRMGDYVAAFDDRFLGLSGTPEAIAAAATPFGIYYQKHEGTAATGYLVDHTASLNVVDQEGRMRLVLPFGISPESIAEDLAHLLR